MGDKRLAGDVPKVGAENNKKKIARSSY